MTYLVERLVQRRRRLDHLRPLPPRVTGREALNRERLPGFRSILVHEYVGLDMDRVVEAIDRLEPIERLLEIVRRLEATSAGDG